ncbi:ABC transporter permease [Serinicoccus sp. CUA-874]|uniref:ABC transporter permease subunit n=1 Tax=Serinicoccus sp. CUA-874 TaxID=1517939 RepID=UPI0022A8DE2F|nr:ABC transporter permease [Serinicoccus sp. CUA-874]
MGGHAPRVGPGPARRPRDAGRAGLATFLDRAHRGLGLRRGPRLAATGGATSPQASGVEPGDVLRHAVLPVLVLALAHLPWFVLVVRDASRDALAGAPVRAAWARGIPRGRLLRSHAVRPALLPLVTVLGVRVPELITGAVLVETVFSWPGIASATVDAALRLDFALLAALTVLTTVLVVLGNLAADLAYRWVDPRVGQRDG